jgi:hypothetical protein
LKKFLITLAKISISLLIIGWLFWSAIKGEDQRKAFFEMLAQPKRWDLLGIGLVLVLVAILFTLLRWCYLVRAVGIEFPLRDGLRIGFLGYLFNLAPMGIVGGDLLKAVMLARERPGNRAKALASVVVDRIVGLYVLFLVASGGVLLNGFWTSANPQVHVVRTAVLAVTAVSTVGIVILLIPGVLEGRWLIALARSPKIGPAVDSLLVALRIYRSDRFVLVLSCLLTVPVHGLLALAVLSFARGLRFTDVPWMDYLSIYSVSGILSTIPLPAGPMETGVVFLYRIAWLKANLLEGAAAVATANQQGLILALTYRLGSILIAPVGVVYYFLGGRREVAEVMHDEEAEEGDLRS